MWTWIGWSQRHFKVSYLPDFMRSRRVTWSSCSLSWTIGCGCWGCVINRGVVLVDLQKWKSQNITGVIEELVRLHLTKGRIDGQMELFQWYFLDLEWFRSDLSWIFLSADFRPIFNLHRKRPFVACWGVPAALSDCLGWEVRWPWSGVQRSRSGPWRHRARGGGSNQRAMGKIY